MSIWDELSKYAPDTSKGGGIKDIAGALGTLYMGNQSYNALGDAVNSAGAGVDYMRSRMDAMPTLESMYGPNSPYAQQMRETLARKDAASGRNSQYGPREAQLQALLADKGAQYAAQQGQMLRQYNDAINAANTQRANQALQQQQIRAQQLASLFNVADKFGVTDKINRGLGDMFGTNQGNPDRSAIYSDKGYGDYMDLGAGSQTPQTDMSNLYSDTAYGDTNYAPQATDAGTGGWVGSDQPYQWY